MVAIAVVGGMLVFVFSQDFFTATDTMTGPTIEILRIFGYDVRDVGNNLIENHEGATCNVVGAAGATLADEDVFAVYVRNLGSNDVIIGDVSVNNVKGLVVADTALASTVAIHPVGPEWAVITTATCGTGTAGSGKVIGAGRDATILIAYDTTTFGDPVKIGRPIFLKVETSSGNIFTKQIVNGRQVG